jgi:uncharacterized membrane protein (UPF0127 family)
MKKTSRLSIYTLSLGFLLPLIVFVTFILIEVFYKQPPEDLNAALTRALLNDKEAEIATDGLFWREYYPSTVPMQIGGVTLEASVAKTWPDRIKGLSETPYLPDGVAKFFVFDSVGYHSIWMKDMQYAIDIIWLDEEGVVVHVVESASPESYPETFTPPVPALYVVEVGSGFVATHEIALGTVVGLPVY